MKTVVKQGWEESERGWGIKPDGYSLHLNEAQRVKYVNAHIRSLPSDHVPEIYVRVSGPPTLIDVDTKTYNQIKKSKLGLRF